jgi:hypothetical protein
MGGISVGLKNFKSQLSAMATARDRQIHKIPKKINIRKKRFPNTKPIFIPNFI